MHPFVLWIDHDHAKLFRISSQGIRRSRIDKTLILHHTPADPLKRKDSDSFFHEVAEALKDAGEILVFGPGLAKRQFMSHLARHHHDGLRKRVVGVRTLAKTSPERVLAASRRFFRVFDRFERPL